MNYSTPNPKILMQYTLLSINRVRLRVLILSRVAYDSSEVRAAAEAHSTLAAVASIDSFISKLRHYSLFGAVIKTSFHAAIKAPLHISSPYSSSSVGIAHKA